MNGLITIEDLARLSKRSKHNIAEWRRLGKLPQATLFGGRYFWSEDQVPECLKSLGRNPGRGRPKSINKK